jgi:hypothetical protein
MPAYAGGGQAKLFRVNSQAHFFNNETISTTPVASVAHELQRPTSMYYPWGASFTLWFSGNPGSFEVDIQTADIDDPTHYCKIASWVGTASLNSSYVGRIELTDNFWAKFVRVNVLSLTNPVLISCMVTR